ncbi:MAG: hypothetical protein IKS18_00765 [Lachnospiraceae bacterium]|nr:hypothetical protein [Lachnospiraceae bacterium]
MRRRNIQFEVFQVILSLGVIGLAVVLFFRSSDLTLLFPLVFGLAALLSLLSALEGTVFNRNRVIKKSRIVVFGILTLVLGGLAYMSYRVVR